MSTGPQRGSVVVGVDASPHSDEAARWAAAYARTRHLPLLLVNGAGMPGLLADVIDAQEARRLLRIASRQATDRALGIARTTAPGVDVSVINPFGDPREVLLETSEEAGMLVVGSRGRGPVRSLLLGSVSVAVLTHAHCPVTVIRGEPSADRPADAPVVVGVDAVGSSGAALAFAFDLAAQRGSRLVVLQAWEPDLFIGEVSAEQRQRARGRHERLLAEALAGFQERYPDLDVERRLFEGHPIAGLKVASSEAAHLVLGSRDRHGVTARIGSVGRSLVEHSHCPVTVIRPASQQRERVQDRRLTAAEPG